MCVGGGGGGGGEEGGGGESASSLGIMGFAIAFSQLLVRTGL